MSAAETIACPSWCVGSHVEADTDPVDGSRFHNGPTFGVFDWAGITEPDGTYRLGSFGADLDEFGGYQGITPDGMRQIARDAAAAAAWQERNGL